MHPHSGSLPLRLPYHLEVICCIPHWPQPAATSGRGRSTSAFLGSDFCYASDCPDVTGKNRKDTWSPWCQTPGWLDKSRTTSFLGGGPNKSASKSYSEIIREYVLFCHQSWEKTCRPSANDNIKDLLWNVSEDGDCGFLSLSRTHCPSVIESPWRHLAAPVYVFLPQKLNELKFQ